MDHLRRQLTHALGRRSFGERRSQLLELVSQGAQDRGCVAAMKLAQTAYEGADEEVGLGGVCIVWSLTGLTRGVSLRIWAVNAGTRSPVCSRVPLSP